MEDKKILFIGNSYTYYNDMPNAIFTEIAKAAGYSFDVKTLTTGGWELIRVTDPADETGALVDTELRDVKYDYVIIQEQSTNPAADPERFRAGLSAIMERVRKNGATPLLYGTWGRESGNAFLEEMGWTNESMTWKMASAYDAAAKEHGIDVAQVGLAFFDVYKTYAGDAGLYVWDYSSHPTYTGSFLAAMTIFAKITHFDPTAIYFCGELSEDTALILRKAAYRAVFETPTIPDEYVVNF